MIVLITLMFAVFGAVFTNTSTVEHDLKDMQSEIKWLKNELLAERRKGEAAMNRYVSDMKEMKNEINLKQDLHTRSIRQVFNENAETLNTYVSAMNEMKDEIKNLKQDLLNRNVRQIRRYSSVEEHKIAFSAQLTHRISGLGHGQPIVFNAEVTDTANAYSTSDGLYIVPVTGMYVFTWSVSVDGGRALECRLLKNGSPFGYTWVDSESGADFGDGTGLVVLHADAGDHVSIVASDGNDVIEGGRHDTFSGWLLYSDS